MFRNAVLAAALGLGLLCVPSLASADANLSAQWVAYGQRLSGQQQYDQAMHAFSTAARADSSNPEAWKGVGNCLYAKHDYVNALKYYRYALQLSPNDARLASFVQSLTSYTAAQGTASGGDAMSLGHQYYAAGQYDSAIQQYGMAASSNPNNALAYQDLGNCFYEKSDKADAVSAYKRSLQINPNNDGLKAFLARYSPQDAQSAGVQVANGPTDWPQPLWRSAICPGWGQFYNGDSTQGWIIGAVTWGSLIGTVGTYVVGSNARNTYNTLPYGSSQSQFTTAYNTWNNMATINNVLAVTFLAAYTFNLVDAIMGAHPMTTAVGLDGDEKAPVQLGMLQNGTVGAQVRLLDF